MAMMFYGYRVGTPLDIQDGWGASWVHANGLRFPGWGPVLHGDYSSVLAVGIMEQV